MAYRKLLVDNTTCSRRFHITFDDQKPAVPHVEVRCQFCDAVVFSADQHPPVQLAREENLVRTTALSEHTTAECRLTDSFSAKTQGQPAGSRH